MQRLIFVGECELGRGLFAAAYILAGSTIHIFFGPTLTSDDVESLGEASCYPIQTGPDSYLDPQPPGRFTNHSCAPNAAIRDGHILVALRDIPLGEEIRFDYSTTMSERRWTMLCRCGADSCRGVITDFHDLPQALQEHYVALGIVQPFIVAERQIQ